MLYVPFIWFTALTIWLWRRQQCVEVSVFLSAQFALTSFVSILVYHMHLLGARGLLYTEENLHLGGTPTILYCVLLTLTIVPFALLNPHNIKNITLPNERIFNLIAYGMFGIFLVTIYLISADAINIFHGGMENLVEIRRNHYEGEETISDIRTRNLPTIIGYAYYFLGVTLLMLPCFFYSICFLHKRWWFNLMLFLSSLSMPIRGITSVDRTEWLFYIQALIICLLLFRPFLKQSQKRVLKLLFIPVIVAIVLFLGAVTLSRWNDKTESRGALGSTLLYAGQNYYNFCYFYEYGLGGKVYTNYMFPTYNHMVKGIDKKDVEETIGEERGVNHGPVSVFATHIGTFLLSAGFTRTVIWTIGFFVLCFLLFRRIKDTASLGQWLIYFILSTIPMFGIFYYRYFSFAQGLTLWGTATIAILFHYTFIFKRQCTSTPS